MLGLLLTSLIAVCRMDAAAAAGQAGPRPGGGGPSGPEPAPGPPDDGPRTVTDDDAGPAAGWPGPHEPGPAIEQDWLVTDLADAALQPAGMR